MSIAGGQVRENTGEMCLDNDQAGNEACEKLTEEIPDRYSVICLKPSRKDWNEILCDKNADRKKAII